jgi:hypothetical protein
MKDLSFKAEPVHLGSGIDLLPFLHSATVREVPGGISGEFHPSTRRQIVVHLTGGGELQCSDGTTHRAEAGDLILYDDLTGEGHRSQSDGDRSNVHLLMYLDPSCDLDGLLAETHE